MPFPLEIITLFGSTIVGSLLKMWGAKQNNQIELHKHMLSVIRETKQSQREAREYKNSGFQWTRRIIALSVVLSVIVLPKIAVLIYPDVNVVFGWTAFHPGLLFLPDKEVLEWKAVEGLAITPLDTHIVSAIVGLYFGGSLAGHHRT